jgi:hypothetical protein
MEDGSVIDRKYYDVNREYNMESQSYDNKSVYDGWRLAGCLGVCK